MLTIRGLLTGEMKSQIRLGASQDFGLARQAILP